MRTNKKLLIMWPLLTYDPGSVTAYQPKSQPSCNQLEWSPITHQPKDSKNPSQPTEDAERQIKAEKTPTLKMYSKGKKLIIDFQASIFNPESGNENDTPSSILEYLPENDVDLLLLLEKGFEPVSSTSGGSKIVS